MDGKNLPIKRERNDAYEGPSGDEVLIKRGKLNQSKTGSSDRTVASSGGLGAVEQKNPFQSLSGELIDLIFQFLPRKDLVNRMVLVDKRSQQVTQGNKGTFMLKGRDAYRNDDFIEAARYFINVSQPKKTEEGIDAMDIDEAIDAMQIDEPVNIDFSHVSSPKDGLAKCLIQMRFLDIPELNRRSDEELLAMPHDTLCALWKDEVEFQMRDLCRKNKKELQVDIYNWSHKAATGKWGSDTIVAPEERMYCCERLIFLLRHSEDYAVRKDAMLALMRVAREMQGHGDLESELVRQSVGRVVDFIRKQGGLNAIGGVAKIVFESLKRLDSSFIAKKALLSALGKSLDPVRDELKRLVDRRTTLSDEVDQALKNSVDASELKEIDRQLEGHARLIAEVERLQREKRELTGGLFSSQTKGLNEDVVNSRLQDAHTRLSELQEVASEVSALSERRKVLQERVFGGLADEAEEQELSAINKRFSDLKGQRYEINNLRDEVQRCKDCLQVLKVDSELSALHDSMIEVDILRERKRDLEQVIKELEIVDALNQVDTRIATLDTFVQGFIEQTSLNLALEELSPEGLEDEMLRKMLMDELCALCFAHPENEKTFNKLEGLLQYMILNNTHITDYECLDFKERLLELERAHPSPARSQRINILLFRIGNSELNFSGDVSVEDDAMTTWLDRISGENETLLEPFPPARISRLACALGSPCIKTESRLRILHLLSSHLEHLAKGDVQDAGALDVLHSFSSSVTSLLEEVATKESAFDLQRELYNLTGNLLSLVPKDWSAALAVLKAVDSDIPDLVRTALRAEVFSSQAE